MGLGRTSEFCEDCRGLRAQPRGQQHDCRGVHHALLPAAAGGERLGRSPERKILKGVVSSVCFLKYSL